MVHYNNQNSLHL